MSAVQAANLLRVISLCYVGQWNRDVFEFAHLSLWQALIMRDVLVVWLLWLLWLRWVALHAGGSLAVCKCRDMTGDPKNDSKQSERLPPYFVDQNSIFMV